MDTYTVNVSLTHRTGTGALSWDSQDEVVTVTARNRDAARMAVRQELERQMAAKGQPTSFVLTFHRVYRHGDRRPWLRLSEASSPRGASMGRRNSYPDDGRAGPRLHLHRVRLDSGGYDEGGAYWGHGLPLYRAVSPEAELFMRALNRDDAKRQVCDKMPGATFYR